MTCARFRDSEFDLSTAELRRAGSAVPLERQPAVVLSLLVSRAGRLVPRDDLRSALWPDGVHVDFDLGLNYCVRQLRSALGDDARNPRFIETVPRQGYRFIAPIGPATPQQARGAATKSHRLAAVLVLAALVGGLVWDSRLVSHQRNPRHHEAAVKVLRALHNVVF